MTITATVSPMSISTRLSRGANRNGERNATIPTVNMRNPIRATVRPLAAGLQTKTPSAAPAKNAANVQIVTWNENPARSARSDTAAAPTQPNPKAVDPEAIRIKLRVLTDSSLVTGFFGFMPSMVACSLLVCQSAQPAQRRIRRRFGS